METSCSIISPPVQLPAVTIPKFDGNSRMDQEFKDCFLSLVHNDCRNKVYMKNSIKVAGVSVTPDQVQQINRTSSTNWNSKAVLPEHFATFTSGKIPDSAEPSKTLDTDPVPLQYICRMSMANSDDEDQKTSSTELEHFLSIRRRETHIAALVIYNSYREEGCRCRGFFSGLILYCFCEPDSGKILINDQNIKDIDVESLRKNIVQDSVLFHYTICHNLHHGNLEKSTEDVYRAVTLANLHTSIFQWQKGYDTQMDERELKLSGGEKQRVAIVRAVLKDSPILVFYVATSSLDSITQEASPNVDKQWKEFQTDFENRHKINIKRQVFIHNYQVK
ncbi:hypothetical protein RUM43_012943 [Polyplax serrata]|uniref:Iron-sulfur clusters transporter ABCB7, mitochondrial n=1 Tax=Polyplax serrata TaxID=468196 RepID=A0AAN8NJN3_POLSC